jgi:TfoX/Sxy family transcriptional regulator of competence genes
MATQHRTIDYLIEQAASAGTVVAKPMFGEYGVYVDGKMIGSVCDDHLFLKPTTSGRVHAEPVFGRAAVSGRQTANADRSRPVG